MNPKLPHIILTRSWDW